MQHRRPILSLLSILIILVAATTLLEYCRPGETDAAKNNEAKATYVGDASCQGCHAKEHTLWSGSDHFRAMMPANDSTVLGDFNNASFTADGVTSRFFRKDGHYFINTEGPDGANHDYEVLHTFGYKPLQQYLVAFPGGRMQVPRVSWDVVKRKWFHQYAGQKIDHHDWLHWSRGGQNWNTMCASCHSTNLQKNYAPEADSFHTTWSTITVSCESCHGPASKHVDFAKSGGYRKGEKPEHGYLLPVKDSLNTTMINTCAPCHARKSDIGQTALHTGEIMDDLIPEIPTTEHFHADGQVNDEDYIYTSFLQSKMYRRNVQCSNCHDPHSGKRLLMGNALCLQCHAKTYDDFQHQRHDVARVQIGCESCHMPGKLYMGNDLRHDHGFRVPRPDQSVKYGTPNACNSCHKDKKASWAAEAVVKWFGPTRKPHFSDDLIPGSELNAQSEAHLTKLFSDTAIPAIVKAAATDYLRQIPTRGSLSVLLGALRDEDAQVRYRALRSLVNFPSASWIDAVGPMLQDKARAVRIAAADAFSQVDPQQIPAAYSAPLSKARMELTTYLGDQLDFPVGNVMLADHYLKQNDLFNAERYYRRGLRMDSMMNYARFNLSSLLNVQRKNDEALKVLQDAERTDPKSERVQYNLALLYAEMKDDKQASACFAKAVSLGSRDPRLYYNYGLFLQQARKGAEAEKVLLKGYALAPDDAEINYALAVFYLQAGQVSKAMPYASALKRLEPDDPNYQALFKQMGI